MNSLEQMIDVHQAAIAARMYDAADWLERNYPWPERIGGWRVDLIKKPVTTDGEEDYR